MVDSISASYSAQTALSVLQSGGSGSSLFNAIAGKGSAKSSADGIFDILSPGATSKSIDEILNGQKSTSSTNSKLTEVAQRLTYMQEGRYDPTADWEKVAAYAMQTGQPLVVTLNGQGQVEANTQTDSDLSRYNTRQQADLLDAMGQIAEMAGKIQGNQTNDQLLAKLDGAEADLMLIKSGVTVAQSDWEKQGSLLMTLNKPFKIALDSKGDLMVRDQATADMSNLTITQQKILRNAVQSIPKIISSGDISEYWQAEAQSYAEAGVPYYLDIDSVTNKITVKENSATNITPNFLKEAPYPDIGANTDLLKQAASFIQDGKGFFLDYDPTGKLVAKEATAQNLIKYNSPSQNQSAALGLGSVLSLLA
jgi:hypothetical protein